MKLFRVGAIQFFVFILCVGATCAAALDAPQTLHHSKSRYLSHFSSTHRATTSKSGSYSSSPRLTASNTSVLRNSTQPTGLDTGPHTDLLATPLWREPPLRRQRCAPLHIIAAIAITSRFTANSFIQGENGAGDDTSGEDPVVRQAAIDALGDMNGTAVVINPANGRILAMVNQKLALSPGAEPCSTIKLTVALAALSESLVTNDTMVQLPGFRMNMNQALAKSNNLYFEELGRANWASSAFAITRRNSASASWPATTFPASSWVNIQIRRFRKLKAGSLACAASGRAFP